MPVEIPVSKYYEIERGHAAGFILFFGTISTTLGRKSTVQKHLQQPVQPIRLLDGTIVAIFGRDR
jgi:hypothetical protein